MKMLSTFKGLPIGTKIKVLYNTNSHNYPMGEVITLKKPGTAASMIDAAKEVSGGNTLNAKDCCLAAVTIPEMENQIAELQKELDSYKEKIVFCKENAMEEFDEEVFEIHNVLKIIEKPVTDLEKAKLIKKLLH